MEKSRQFEELQGEMRKVEWSTHKLEQEKSELNERIEEEQISNSRDRENLEKEWKTKLDKEKPEHDLELQQLKEKVRTGNQIREIREQTIERTEKYLEQLKEYGKRMDEMRKEACERGGDEKGIMGKSF